MNKVRKLIHLKLLFTILISFGCKKIDQERLDPDLNMEGQGALAAINAQINAANLLFKYGAFYEESNIKVAMMKVAEEMRKTKGVKSVQVYDSLSMLITVDSGLSAGFSIDKTNDQGQSLSRGGQKNGKLTELVSGNDTRVNMKNKTVALFPYDEYDFYPPQSIAEKEFTELREKIRNSPIKPNYIFQPIDGPDVVDFFKEMRNYGLVILICHGFPYGWQLRTFEFLSFEDEKEVTETVVQNGIKKEITRKKIELLSIENEEDLRKAFLRYNEEEFYEMILSNEIVTNIEFKVTESNKEWWKSKANYWLNKRDMWLKMVLTTKAFEKFPSWDSTVLFANSCYSGTTRNNQRDEAGFLAIGDVMQQKKLAAYYGWLGEDKEGHTISNKDAIVAEKSFVQNFLYNFDTTGAAHTDNGIELKAAVEDDAPGVKSILTLFGSKNYWYGCGEGSFTDPRDQQKYRTICINGKQWFAENLRYNAAGSASPNGQPANIGIFGRLYTWSQLMNGEASSNANPSKVKGLCPQGWHIPSLSEYQALFNYLGGLDKAGRLLKSKTNWKPSSFPGVDSLKFSLVPAGGYEPGPGYFSFGDFETLWTSYSPTANFSTINAVQFSNFSNSAFIAGTTNPGQSGNPKYFPCRCAKD